MQALIAILTILLGLSVIGYVISVIREKYDLMHQQVVIKSKVVTQRLLDELDLKAFKLGRSQLILGDEIQLKLKDNNSLRGVVLGARKATNVVCLVTSKDEIVEVQVSNIQKLSVLAKYGRLF